MHSSKSSFLLAFLFCLLIGGCGGENDSSSADSKQTGQQAEPTQEATATPEGELKFKVTGECHSQVAGGGLRNASNGFTPSNTYTQSVTYPDGSPYRYLKNDGVGNVNQHGAVIWTWFCGDGPNGQPDPPGKYSITLIDNGTGRRISATFRIRPAKK